MNTDTKSLIEEIVNRAMIVGSTFGPLGDLVLIDNPDKPFTTKDGYQIIRAMKKDKSLAARLLVDAAEKVALKAGDGTTTTCLLAALALKNRVDLKSLDIDEYIKKHVNVEKATEDSVVRVAQTAAKDMEIGEAIGKLVWDLGEDGHIQAVQGFEFATEKIAGYSMPGSLMLPQTLQLSHPAIGNHHSHISVQRPLIVSIAHTVRGYKSVNAVLQSYHKQFFTPGVGFSRPLIMIFADLEKEGLDYLASNISKNGFPILPVVVQEKRPMMRYNILTDLEFLTGADVYSTVGAKKINVDGEGFKGRFGESLMAYLSLKDTRFVCEKDPTERIEFVKGQGEDDTDTKKRISLLRGAVGQITVPLTTDVEGMNIELSIEDGVRSAQAVLKHGSYTGGKEFWEMVGVHSEEIRPVAMALADLLPRNGSPTDSILALREAYKAAASLVSQIKAVKYVV